MHLWHDVSAGFSIDGQRVLTVEDIRLDRECSSGHSLSANQHYLVDYKPRQDLCADESY